tara:strand:+ start:79 stop:363 length:285 start_codon:yes stop_codon:yes gene_type:complete
MRLKSKGKAMNRLWSSITAFALGILACLSWQMANEVCKVEIVKPQVETRVPSLADVQRMIGANPDGVYGQETKEKWNRAVCDQHAKDAWERLGE